MIVHLSIGGTAYVASPETLSRSAYFEALVKYASPDAEPSFVDRDGTHFRWILNWLRGSTVTPRSVEVYQELLVEADFYGVAVPPRVSGSDEELVAALDRVVKRM